MAQDQPPAGKTAPNIFSGRFANPWPTWTGLPAVWDVFKWQLFTKKEMNTPSDIEKHLPVYEPAFVPTPDCGAIVTWLGHASVVVQMDGFNIITDPVFAPRCSPFSFYGPLRYRPPPCGVDDLPELHAVVISHNHYDHLDLCAVRQLHGRFGDNLRWFVPLGLKSWFQKTGVNNVAELNWWESSRIRKEIHQPNNGNGVEEFETKFQELEMIFLPCQHWSMRVPGDRNLSLWGSWAAIGNKHRFYFAGDTGYCPEFKNIGAHYGPFDISAIPIGCYKPRYFMCNQHIDPEDAVKIHQDVRSKYSLGIHWGTYHMGSIEAPLAPKADLAEAIRQAGINTNSFFTLHHGQSWTVPQ